MTDFEYKLSGDPHQIANAINQAIGAMRDQLMTVASETGNAITFLRGVEEQFDREATHARNALNAIEPPTGGTLAERIAILGKLLEHERAQTQTLCHNIAHRDQIIATVRERLEEVRTLLRLVCPHRMIIWGQRAECDTCGLPIGQAFASPRPANDSWQAQQELLAMRYAEYLDKAGDNSNVPHSLFVEIACRPDEEREQIIALAEEIAEVRRPWVSEDGAQSIGVELYGFPMGTADDRIDKFARIEGLAYQTADGKIS